MAKAACCAAMANCAARLVARQRWRVGCAYWRGYPANRVGWRQAGARGVTLRRGAENAGRL